MGPVFLLPLLSNADGRSAIIGRMDIRLIVQYLRQQFPSLLAVYGFGSYFSGQARRGSDIDLAVLVEGKVPADILWQQACALANQVQRDVDLLDLRTATTVMQYQVVTTGQRLWHRDNLADLYESFILSEKTALDAARADYLHDIQQSGRIYGG